MQRQRSPFGSVRAQAFTAWNGPEVLCTPGEVTGRNVLRLAVYHNITTPLLESRIVYARLFAEEEEKLPYALLRAVFWDGSAARQAMQKQGATATLTMPARYVKIAYEQVHQWLQAFEGIPIFWEPQEATDLDTFYTLRIQYDDVTSVLERTWQGPLEMELDRCWQQVWKEMSALLTTAPIVEQMEEQFWGERKITPDVYDFQGYRSDFFPFDVH